MTSPGTEYADAPAGERSSRRSADPRSALVRSLEYVGLFLNWTAKLTCKRREKPVTHEDEQLRHTTRSREAGLDGADCKVQRLDMVDLVVTVPLKYGPRVRMAVHRTASPGSACSSLQRRRLAYRY